MNALKIGDAASCEHGSADIWNDPVCMIPSGPAVEEEADWDEERAGDHEGHAEFGYIEVLVARFETLVDFVLERHRDLGVDEETCAE